VDGLDNLETRYLLNEACDKNKVPYVYGGVVGSGGMMMNILPGETPCLECLMGPLPEEGSYDGYLQLENGVGMMRIFIDEFKDALEQLTNSKEYPKLREKLQRVVTIAVGKLTYPTMKKFTEQMEILFPGLTINIFYIRNDFFGETITVSGLITGQDLVKQIKERQDNGEELGRILNIPSNMLRIGEQVFLDDMTVAEVETKLGMKLVPVESGGKDFIEAIINPDYSINRDNGNFVYIQAYDR